jgi:hypothetical protein
MQLKVKPKPYKGKRRKIRPSGDQECLWPEMEPEPLDPGMQQIDNLLRSGWLDMFGPGLELTLVGKTLILDNIQESNNDK